jgi:hypothetical protein
MTVYALEFSLHIYIEPVAVMPFRRTKAGFFSNTVLNPAVFKQIYFHRITVRTFGRPQRRVGKGYGQTQGIFLLKNKRP